MPKLVIPKIKAILTQMRMLCLLIYKSVEADMDLTQMREWSLLSVDVDADADGDVDAGVGVDKDEEEDEDKDVEVAVMKIVWLEYGFLDMSDPDLRLNFAETNLCMYALYTFSKLKCTCKELIRFQNT